MAKKRKDKKEGKVEEPKAHYDKGNILIFSSFKEQEEYELTQMAQLTPLEILSHLRMFINVAFGMHGYDPENLPSKHDIKIIKGTK